MSETLANLLPQVEEAMEYVKFVDFQEIMKKEDMSKFDIYTRGFTVLPRLVEEMKLQLKIVKDVHK